MRIIQVTPGLLPIPPNGWGAVEKIIWEYHNKSIDLGHSSEILYLDQVKRENYDILHIHVANLAIMAHERGLPYIFTMHDHHSVVNGKDSEIYRQNMEAINKSVISFVPARFLIPHFNNSSKLAYLSHGVNNDEFTPHMDFFKNDVFITNTFKHRLLCVANNGYAFDQSYDRKGFGLAIEAAMELNLPITIAGPSNNKNFFDKNVFNYDKLTILYDLTEDQLKYIYKDHTIFLHPSEMEAGHPNLTLLEAMASGLPIVGTIESDILGMVSVDRDLTQIVRGINHIVSNYPTYRKMAIDAADMYDYRKVVGNLINFYENSNKTKSMRDILINNYENTEISRLPIREVKNSVNIHFVDGPYVEINGNKNEDYNIKFIDSSRGNIVYDTKINNNMWTRCNRKYYTNWRVMINNTPHMMNLNGSRVFIKFESKSIGDNIAWMPYVEEFRKKNNCYVICSTFHNYLFDKKYPEIEFVNPGSNVDNLRASYSIGWFFNSDNEPDLCMHPNSFMDQPMQKTASDILGIPFTEIKPKIDFTPTKDGLITKNKFVTIAIHATALAKYWNNPIGWQTVVDYIKSKGYDVVLLSNEHPGYMGVNDPNGIIRLPADGKLTNVMNHISNSEFFLGLPSGLAWVSWALNKKTYIVSGFSEPYTEPEEIVKILPPKGTCTGCFNKHRISSPWEWCPVNFGTDKHFECTKLITPEQVISQIEHLL